MPKPYPQEFRDDVVAVARRGEAPLKQVAADFGISAGCLANWMRAAEVEDGTRDGVTARSRLSCGNCVNATGCWNRRTRSCARPPPISPRVLCGENSLPARP